MSGLKIADCSRENTRCRVLFGGILKPTVHVLSWYYITFCILTKSADEFKAMKFCI